MHLHTQLFEETLSGTIFEIFFGIQILSWHTNPFHICTSAINALPLNFIILVHSPFFEQTTHSLVSLNFLWLKGIALPETKELKYLEINALPSIPIKNSQSV